MTKKESMANRWNNDAFESREIAYKILEDIKKGVEYTHHPLFDWRPAPNLRLSTIETNEMGLRSKPLKGLNSRKCVLIGGSFSWGYGASSNSNTPAYILEAMLNGHGNDVSIVNLADQMYASSQQIKSFIFSVQDLKPSHVICVTGYNDTSQGFKNIYRNHPKYQETTSFAHWGTQAGLISNESNLKKAAKLLYHRKAEYKDPYGDKLTFAHPSKEDIPHEMCGHTVNVIRSYCLANDIKVGFVLEPLVYFKNNSRNRKKLF
jgi:hypothetical protein